MGYLSIKQVEYYGKKYYYKSPIFEDGLNIIEGKNRTGKTTLTDMICYALGDYIEQFDFQKECKHTEIFSDTENYIELLIGVNEVNYFVRRYMKDNNNKIFVKEGNDFIILDVKRHLDNQVFSDWLLEKLEIQPVEIYQGKYKGKINFTDLLRLMHYDQLTNPAKVYKTARLDGNFISDSIIIRKAIFEILMGQGVIDYYIALNDCVNAEREYQTKKSLSDYFAKSSKQLYGIEINEVESYSDEIEELEKQIELKENEQSEILEKEYDEDAFNKELGNLREELINQSFLLQRKRRHQRECEEKIGVVQELIENRNIEIDQLEKIIFTHKELNLFAPNTCPYCFNKVTRKEGHCVCGEEIEETSFQRYFYDTKEYVDMLIQRKKSLKTLNQAYNDLVEEREDICKKKQEIQQSVRELNENINRLKLDAKTSVNSVGIKRIVSEIASLENKLRVKREIQNAYDENHKLKDDESTAKEKFDIAKENLKREEALLNSKLEQVVGEFSTIYNTLLTSVLEGCTSADIDKDYMPVINEGKYINASSHVPKRIVYYLTLLKLSLINEVKFPRLLIIDTPENLGIDEDNLLTALSLIEDIEGEKYQIILTTGENKYPPQFKKYVKENLTDKKLLQIREQE